MEAPCFHGENMVSFQMVTGQQWWHVVGYYITPEYTSTIEDVVTAIGRQIQGFEFRVARDFNEDLANPEGSARSEEITAALESDGLEEISPHILLKHKSW